MLPVESLNDPVMPEPADVALPEGDDAESSSSGGGGGQQAHAAPDLTGQGDCADVRDVELQEPDLEQPNAIRQVCIELGSGAAGATSLGQTLALHSQALVLHLSRWADEQERLLGVLPGNSFGPKHLETPKDPACDLVSKALIRSDTRDQGQVRGDKSQTTCGTTRSSTHSLYMKKRPTRALLRETTKRVESLFTPAHVAEVMNSTPGLRQESSKRTPASALSTRFSKIIAPCSCCSEFKALQNVERSTWFNTLCNLAIVLNTVLLTYSSQVHASGDYTAASFDYMETLFCLFYTSELLLRVLVHRCSFFSGPDAGWRLLDTVLVVVSLLEQLSRLGLGASGLNVSYVRAIRMLKILKVLRVLRVMRSLKELRLLLDSILGSVRSLVWSFLVMFFETFLFAIAFVQAASDPDPRAGIPAREPWNSITSAMSALFLAATGGLDWEELANGLYEDGPHYYLLMFLYIGVFIFVIENALTSMFVEKLLDNVQHDENFVVQDRLERRIEYVEKIQGLFDQMQQDGNGRVSFEELCGHLHDQRMSSFAASLDIDESDLTMCFSIITANGKHKIDADAFVVACIKLRGNAKSVDMIDISLTQSKISQMLVEMAEEQHRLAAFCGRQFRAMQKSSPAVVAVTPSAQRLFWDEPSP